MIFYSKNTAIDPRSAPNPAQLVNITDVTSFKKAIKKEADRIRNNPNATWYGGYSNLTDEEVIFVELFAQPISIYVENYGDSNLCEYLIRIFLIGDWNLSNNYLENLEGATKTKKLKDHTDYDSNPALDITEEYRDLLKNFFENLFNKFPRELLFDMQHYRRQERETRQQEAESQANVDTTTSATSTPTATTSSTTSGNTPTRSETVTVSVNAPSDLLRLLRVNVTCLDPMKKEYKGEIFTVGNDVIGSVKKYVPFNTTDGWHVPAIIVQQLRDKECQIFQSVKNDKGQEIRTGKTIKAYIVQELPPLTPEELAELAKVQSAQGL